VTQTFKICRNLLAEGSQVGTCEVLAISMLPWRMPGREARNVQSLKKLEENHL